MNLNDTSLILLKKIDDLNRKYHTFINQDDNVYFLGEYIPLKRNIPHPNTKLILNYKQSPKHKSNPNALSYKINAIKIIANKFRLSILASDLSHLLEKATLVPIPPSKDSKHPEYDDRNTQMLKLMSPKSDIRELIYHTESRKALHNSDERNPDKIIELYNFNTNLKDPNPIEIWLFDDVIVTGSTFKAAKDFLKKIYPNAIIRGFYIARNVPT